MVKVLIDARLTEPPGRVPEVKVYIDDRYVGAITKTKAILVDVAVGMRKFYALPPSGYRISFWRHTINAGPIDTPGNPVTLEITEKTGVVLIWCERLPPIHLWKIGAVILAILGSGAGVYYLTREKK